MSENDISSKAAAGPVDASGRGTASPRVGVFPPSGLLEQGPQTARAFLERVDQAGIDHVCCGDHVGFFTGLGFDGLVQATVLTMLHPTLPVYTGVYLLPLRHPVLVARQFADIGRLAPGRLIFGAGMGGEDRHEVEICGVDPATRGLRMNESLAIVRQLLTGQPVSFHGTFFDLDGALIVPAPATPVPVIIGGRSDAAIRRAGSATAGSASGFPPGASRPPWRWPRRRRRGAGRPDPPSRHAMQVWCGLAASKEEARACLAPAMQDFYQLPFERFERYCPCGTADDVAGFLAPYAAAGCTEFNLIPQSPDPGQAIAGAAAVRKLLARA